MRNIGMALAAAFALSLPVAAKSAAKAEVQCTDGSTSRAGRGACSHHGGVAKAGANSDVEPSTGAPAAQPSMKTRADNQAREPQDTRPVKNKGGGGLGGFFGRRSTTATPRSSTRDAKSGSPTARCKDGTTSYSAHHSGTCSGHGGVQEWLDR